MNRNYYKISRIIPYEGHYSREISKALIYALQYEEGINKVTGTFWPETKKRSPHLPKDKRYNKDKLEKFIKLIQFSLYFNGYKNISFKGKYDDLTRNAIEEFQDFMKLDITNDCNIDTIMSLFISKGNPNRKSLACVWSIKLDDNKAKMLYDEGYRFDGRYLTNVPGGRD